MPDDVRTEIHQAIIKATALAAGRDIISVAHEMCRQLSNEALAVLAEAALVEQIRTNLRRDGLAVERSAEWAPRKWVRPRQGTRAYREWVADTPEGADYENELLDWRDRRDSGLTALLNETLSSYAEELRITWTAQLLGSSFALPDGTTTTWGAATMEQHEQRRDMFLGNAHANLEGAARHSIAIQTLQEAGALTLTEAVRTAAMGS